MHTFPYHLNAFTKEFVYGPRVSYLLSLPFSPSVLKKRVMRKNKDKTKAEGAYYIDLRDMADRLDWVVGSMNWDMDIQLQDLGDRVGVISCIEIGGVKRYGESEELKEVERTDYSSGKKVIKPNELCVLRCGPNATKRAAALHGIGSYLYKFSTENTWEEIDNYGNFKDKRIDTSKFKSWAMPVSGAQMIITELKHLYQLEIPNVIKDISKEQIDAISQILLDDFNVSTLKNLTEEEYFRIAGAIARQTDYIGAQPRELAKPIDINGKPSNV